MLRTAFRDYLVAGATREGAAALADALATRQTASAMAEHLRAYALHGAHEVVSVSGEHAHRRVFIGARPPAEAAIGALWFDVVDLSTSELIPAVRHDRASREEMIAARAGMDRSVWIALEPVARWQLAAFLDVAPIERKKPRALDPARLLAGPDLEPATSLACDEAGLYLDWFHKWFPHALVYEAAAVYFERGFWSRPDREWTGSSGKTSGMVEITSPSLLPLQFPDDEDEDPDDDLWMVPGGKILDDVTFRSCHDARLATLVGDHQPHIGASGASIASRFPRPPR